MNLLVFAHRAEAKSFFSAGNFKQELKHQNLLLGHLNGDPTYILICGEGIHSAISSLSQCLGVLGDKVQQVINYGICGALRNEIELGTIYEIKTCYGEDEFKSFTHSHKNLDLITSKQRVVSQELRDHLDNFAPLVDREAWGLSYSCKEAKIILRVFKIVSDYANDQEICSVVKENAPLWSDQMLSHYLNLEEFEKNITNDFLPFSKDQFHITISQQRILKNLIRSLELKGYELEKIDFTDITKQKMRAKEKTKLLIEKLHSILNPLDYKIKQDLNSLASPFRNQGINIRFDNDLENHDLHLSFTVHDQKHMSKIIKTLSKFDYNKLSLILDGKTIDV